MEFVENVEKNLSSLASVIGAENVKDVQKRIADLIVESVKNDIDYYKKQTYVFYPPDYIKGISDDALESVEPKIRKMYKEAMLDIAKESVERAKKSLMEPVETVEMVDKFDDERR